MDAHHEPALRDLLQTLVRTEAAVTIQYSHKIAGNIYDGRYIAASPKAIDLYGPGILDDVNRRWRSMTEPLKNVTAAKIVSEARSLGDDVPDIYITQILPPKGKPIDVVKSTKQTFLGNKQAWITWTYRTEEFNGTASLHSVIDIASRIPPARQQALNARLLFLAEAIHLCKKFPAELIFGLTNPEKVPNILSENIGPSRTKYEGKMIAAGKSTHRFSHDCRHCGYSWKSKKIHPVKCANRSMCGREDWETDEASTEKKATAEKLGICR